MYGEDYDGAYHNVELWQSDVEWNDDWDDDVDWVENKRVGQKLAGWDKDYNEARPKRKPRARPMTKEQHYGGRKKKNTHPRHRHVGCYYKETKGPGHPNKNHPRHVE